MLARMSSMDAFTEDHAERPKGPATQPARKRPRAHGVRGPHTLRKNPGKRPRKGGGSR
jgi:hypothetical protein